MVHYSPIRRMYRECGHRGHASTRRGSTFFWLHAAEHRPGPGACIFFFFFSLYSLTFDPNLCLLHYYHDHYSPA